MEEGAKSKEKTEANAKKFMEEYKLKEKKKDEILKLFKDHLKYEEISSWTENNIKTNLSSIAFAAMEAFCTNAGTNNSGTTFNKYCSGN